MAKEDIRSAYKGKDQ